MKHAYVGACFLIVGVLLILHGNSSLLPFDIPKESIAFSIPADGSSYTQIGTVEIMIADPALADPSFLKTIKYHDTSGVAIELFRNPVITTKWVCPLSSPLKEQGQYRFWFTFISWYDWPYPWPNGESGGTYNITESVDHNGDQQETDWYRIVETACGVAFLGSGIIIIGRGQKNA